MQRLNPTAVQLYPRNENELYPFLSRVAQEWQFTNNAWALQVPGITELDVAATAGARDFAIRLFNEWMNEMAGRQWFRVLQRYEMTEETWVKEEVLMYAAGTKLLVPHHCEVVLAHIEAIDQTIFDSEGREILIGRPETVWLHCLIARRNEFKRLPMEVVPSVSILNH